MADTDPKGKARKEKDPYPWATRAKKVRKGSMTQEELFDWSWQTVLNGINVAIGRIKRAEKNHRDPPANNIWATVSDERGRAASPLAEKTLAHIESKLQDRGYAKDEYYIDRGKTARGRYMISIDVKNLRKHMVTAAA